MERFERSGTVVDPRQSLALWLRAGRAQRKLSLEEVARITKIQTRILEKLESGRFEGLPADVFVRGFVRSFARCVGLDEGEALERYGECASATARAYVEILLPPVPVPVPDSISAGDSDSDPVSDPDPVPVAVSDPVPVTVAAAEPAAEAPKKKRSRKKASSATGTTPPRTRKKKVAVEAPVIADGSGEFPPAEPVAVAAAEAVPVAEPVTAAAEPEPAWQPTMPPLPAPTPAPPWRRPTLATLAAPSLVIDDEDPDRAEREQDAKLAASAAREASRVAFLPPILLDREDRSQGQGGLTLAVIILLIAATLTLSYLMRRPSPSGDGMTMNDVHQLHDAPAHVTLS